MKKSIKLILLTVSVLLSFSCEKPIKKEMSYTLMFNP